MGMILTVCDVINASLNSCAAGNNEKVMNGKYLLPLMLLLKSRVIDTDFDKEICVFLYSSRKMKVLLSLIMLANESLFII